MKFQDSSFNGLKVIVGTESVTHPRTHALTDAPKAICPINFFKVGGIKISCLGQLLERHHQSDTKIATIYAFMHP